MFVILYYYHIFNFYNVTLFFMAQIEIKVYYQEYSILNKITNNFLNFSLLLDEAILILRSVPVLFFIDLSLFITFLASMWSAFVVRLIEDNSLI
jgi:hypothetical protein